jgi:hypothetical protein
MSAIKAKRKAASFHSRQAKPSGRANSPPDVKLFYIDGIRHKAVVLAKDEEEAIKLAAEASRTEESPNVMCGSVGAWEAPEAYELKLPKGYRLVAESDSS